MKKNIRESDYQRAIIDYLSMLEKQGKLLFQRTNNTAIYDPKSGRFRSLAKGQKKGFPDIMVFTGGTSIGLEVKTPTGKQSKEQKLMEKRMREQGTIYKVVVTIDDVKKAMNEVWTSEKRLNEKLQELLKEVRVLERKNEILEKKYKHEKEQSEKWYAELKAEVIRNAK